MKLISINEYQNLKRNRFCPPIHLRSWCYDFITISFTDPPSSVTLTGSNGFATEGDLIRLECAAIGGIPEPVLKILRDDVMVETDKPPSIIHEFTVQASDDGAKFDCDAGNVAGPAVASLTISVKCEFPYSGHLKVYFQVSGIFSIC